MWFQISWWIDALFSFHLSSLMPSICAWSQYIRRAKLKDIKSRWHLLQVNSWRNTTDSCIQGFDSIYKFAYLLESQLDVHFRPTARHDRTKPRFCQTMTFSPQQTSNHDSNLAPEITAKYWLRSILVTTSQQTNFLFYVRLSINQEIKRHFLIWKMRLKQLPVQVS